MRFLPIFMNIRGRPCLVVGGGQVAARKVYLLHRAGGRVTVVSPGLCDELQRWVDAGDISFVNRGYKSTDLDHAKIVIAATNQQAINEQIAKEADARGIPVNVVDNQDLCTFIMPSIIDRTPVQIAISTGGASPVLARLLRATSCSRWAS